MPNDGGGGRRSRARSAPRCRETAGAVMLILLLAATGTALATGLGAIPVFFLGPRAAASSLIASGAMAVASVVGLILPGLDEASPSSVGAGVAVGAGFLLGVRGALEARQRHLHRAMSAGLRASILVFVVLLVHSLPEGFAIGTAYASRHRGSQPVRDRRNRDSEHPGGNERRDPDGRSRLLTLSSVLGRCRDERASARRRSDRVPARRGDRAVAPRFVRVRGRRCLRWWWSSCSRSCAAWACGGIRHVVGGAGLLGLSAALGV